MQKTNRDEQESYYYCSCQEWASHPASDGLTGPSVRIRVSGTSLCLSGAVHQPRVAVRHLKCGESKSSSDIRIKHTPDLLDLVKKKCINHLITLLCITLIFVLASR